jgi:hypothetical protein
MARRFGMIERDRWDGSSYPSLHGTNHHRILSTVKSSILLALGGFAQLSFGQPRNRALLDKDERVESGVKDYTILMKTIVHGSLRRSTCSKSQYCAERKGFYPNLPATTEPWLLPGTISEDS